MAYVKKVVCPAFILIIALSAASADEELDYAQQIQPILAKRCYQCHGPSKHEGGLRLNSREAALADLESGEFAIVAGKPASSALIHRISTKDEFERMPPEGKPLTADQIAVLRRWIEQGAEWDRHWAFQNPTRPSTPEVKDQSWVRTPIDAFVLKRLEDAGIGPASSADKVALIRRAYYDLTGLPPTPEQVDAFVGDRDPKAYEQLIDQLLDSPNYGEKWARHWLDLVRYAETNGYERDSKKDLIWKYRDYVIRSFNNDKPFDRFVLEQLAGDELPDKDADSITATGFYRLGIWDDEPADRTLARYDYLDDILRTSGEAMLGLTIGCARCHDHKIDPISQVDYYSMLSFFSDISQHGKGKANHVPISVAQNQAAEKQLAEKKKREAMLQARVTAIESEFLTGLANKYPDLSAKARGPRNGVLLADSINSGQQWEYTFDTPADNWFEIAYDDSKWKKGPGGFGAKGTPGSIVRTEWRTRHIWLRKDFRLADIPKRLTLNIHHDEDATVYLNGKQIASFDGYLRDYEKVDVTAQASDVLQTGRNTLAIHCQQTSGGQYIDAGLIADQSTPLAILAQKYGPELIGENRLVEWNQSLKELAASQAQKVEANTKSDFAMAVAERGRNKMWVLLRGNPQSKSDEVTAAFPKVLDPPSADVPSQYDTGQTSGKRRVLAEWIASPENPLTARVMVNRIWQHHFGRGLVRSTSDFGFQGTPPTHPKLLDWLATEFVDRGWSIKAMHKLIMMSASYQMSSQPNSAAFAKDPANNLLWRFNMRRLTAEEIRDSILSVGGTLNQKMYGPPVFPPLPKEVLATSSKPGSAWGNSSPEDARRRSVYVHVKRSLRPPMMANFDVPDTDSSCSARLSTTVPTQALGMLNSQFMQEQASILAARLQTEQPDKLAEQVARAIRLTTGRKPLEQEVNADIEFIESLKTEDKLSPQEALRHYCLLILNTNEFVYLD